MYVSRIPIHTHLGAEAVPKVESKRSRRIIDSDDEDEDEVPQPEEKGA